MPQVDGAKQLDLTAPALCMPHPIPHTTSLAGRPAPARNERWRAGKALQKLDSTRAPISA